MKDYAKMWEEIGFNLDAHTGLMGVLTDAYKGI
jgi:hypothetical protein